MYKEIENLINEYESIVIFRHEFADPDALGSQFGLKKIIEDNYNKKVYALGKNVRTLSGVLFPKSDEISDEIIKESLIIVLDTANKERIDDQRYNLGKKIIKIDHHPAIDQFGDVNCVISEMCATSFIIGDYVTKLNLMLSDEAATYLYAGLVGDTGRFLHNNTNFEVFTMAAFLTANGANIQDVYNKMYSRSIDETKLTGFILENFKTKGKIAYYILEEKDYSQFSINFEKAKEYVNTLADIEGIDIWVSCTYNPDTEFYHVSIRSKSIVINDVAQEFGGGGHKYASGVKASTLDRFNLILNALLEK